MTAVAEPLAPPAPANAALNILSAHGIVTGFGSHAVLHGVDVAVRRGEIAGIFGLNGAGKSVFLKVLSGLVPAWDGHVVFETELITHATPEARVARGIGNVPQGRQVFAEMTVEQNLRLGAYQLRRRDRGRYAAVLESVYERFPVLGSRRGQVAGTMSGGEQASLAVARSLMSEPRLLLIDEPSAGLAPKVVEDLFEVLARLNRDGLSILLVEQNVTFGLRLVHTANLLRGGRVVYSGATAELDRERVVNELGIGRLLSRSVAAAAPAAPPPSPPPSAREVPMTSTTVAPSPRRHIVERDFQLTNGRIHAELSGTEGQPVLISINGLSANLRSFDVIYNALDQSKHRLVAYDCRGRGRSEETGPGTYTWEPHARDVLELADKVGAETFDLAGWSFGTWVALKVCELAPHRVRRLVLIDGGGMPDETSTAPIYAGLERLATVIPSREIFAHLAQQSGNYDPWDRWWPIFDYEFKDVDGGIQARTSQAASWEDENFRRAQGERTYELWPHATMPTLLVRAGREIVPGGGYILTEADAERFVREGTNRRLVTIDAQHYGVGLHDDTAAAVKAFLEEE
ncbi:MAG: alpha/beta fold hydrolase [Candidatus Dormibacteria bacterium]